MGFIGATLVQIVGQLRSLEGDTLMLVARFLIRAGKAPEGANRFVQSHLKRILDEVEAGPPRPPRVVPSREAKKP